MGRVERSVHHEDSQGGVCSHPIAGSVKIVGLLKNNKHPHLLRWFSHLESLDSTQAAIASLAGM